MCYIFRGMAVSNIWSDLQGHWH